MLKNILKGIKAYTGTFALISKLKLWKYFLVPILISVLTAAIVVLLAIWLSGSIGGFIAQIWIWDWGKEVFTTVSNFLGATIIVVIGLLLYKHIVMALSAPFMSPVSEKIEAHLTGVPAHSHTNTSFSEQLWRGIRINVRNLVKEILFTIPILLLGLIPVVGIASTILLFLMQAYYAGFGNMDYTLERHLKYKESIVLVRKNRGLAIGNGIIFMLFLFVPLVGIILVLPLSVTAATVKTIEILKKDTLAVKK
ncbi:MULTISPECIES: EI24 domain-containing protein [unclassified Cellulophaga]|uniref:EI24 domain-containing protein n=1 Tax=unclassified Cellulophaga TaxID=2634405 RepID=UPI0026E303FF|nr:MULTISPECIES: EI24 domain-containing protein [unclassified Cellulophaga]MDO6489930.1 EI24 domain-containing protein [Cellulophaga sp. 2_MG-2023]MDO6494876.1 EI24 domain-containing protein [Cellulophaga sp. 3_MG-2023]